MTGDSVRRRCAQWATDVRLRPAGTAPHAPEGVVLVEWPLPWPRSVGDAPEVASVAAEAERVGMRFLLVAGPHRPAGDLLVCAYRPAGSRTVGYQGAERRYPRDRVPDAVRRLLAGGDGGVPATGVDVVVFTHGRRDACCGREGTVLYRQASAAAPPGTRIWRSSHQGGHRFAPTVLVLPEGTSWARLRLAELDAVLRRSGAPGAVADRYQGSTWMADPRGQALDACAFRAEGWGWLATPREATSCQDGRVRVRARLPGGACWEAVVQPGTPVSAPGPEEGGCDGPDVTYRDWLVEAFRRTLP